MIVDIINIVRISLVQTEYDSPIGANGHSIKAFQFALQRVKPEPRQIHINSSAGCIQPRQNVAQLVDMIGVNATWIIVLIQTF